MMRLVVIGAGGHARSVMAAIRSAGDEVVACTDPRPELHGTTVDGVPVAGGDDQLQRLATAGVDGAALGVGGIGDNTPRRRLLDMGLALGLAFPPVVHARAVVEASAELGQATVVLAGAVVGAGARLQANVIVNTSAVVEHDCAVGDDVHIATGALLGGAVTVERGAHVGIGAVVLQGVVVGEQAIVGAGAVVVRDVRAGVVVVGVPAVERGSAG